MKTETKDTDTNIMAESVAQKLLKAREEVSRLQEILQLEVIEQKQYRRRIFRACNEIASELDRRNKTKIGEINKKIKELDREKYMIWAEKNPAVTFEMKERASGVVSRKIDKFYYQIAALAVRTKFDDVQLTIYDRINESIGTKEIVIIEGLERIADRIKKFTEDQLKEAVKAGENMIWMEVKIEFK